MPYFRVKVLSKEALAKSYKLKLVVDQGAGILMEMYLKKESSVEMKLGSFYCIGPAVDTTHGSIGIRSETKIMPTSEFETKQIEDDFFHAAVVSTVEAKHSPKRRRLSLSGTIEEITDKKGDDWHRQEVVIRDQTGKATVKLWNREAVPADAVHSTVTVRNLEVTDYKNSTELSSTPQTKVELSELEETIHDIEVYGLDETNNIIIGAIDKQQPTEFNIRTDTDFQKVPKKMRITAKGKDIVAIDNIEYM